MKTIKIVSKVYGTYEIKVDDSDYEMLSEFTWCVKSTGYAATTFRGKCHYMHRMILGLTDGKVCVDHKDKDRKNNTRNNLRIATRAQNSRNMSKPRCGSSKYKGVSLYQRDSIWCAFLKTNKKTQYLGRFESEEEAAKAYDLRAMELFGEFASLNFKYCEPSKYCFRMVVSDYESESRTGLQKIKNMPFLQIQTGNSLW